MCRRRPTPGDLLHINPSVFILFLPGEKLNLVLPHTLKAPVHLNRALISQLPLLEILVRAHDDRVSVDAYASTQPIKRFDVGGLKFLMFGENVFWRAI